MKRYFFLSIVFIITFSLNSCENKSSDESIPENDPSGYYTYTSFSKYYTDDNDEPISNTSDGYMNVSWYQGSSNISITVSPFYGYQYFLTGDIIETHGDTTLFRFRGQVVNINNQSFTVIGNNAVDVPNFGKYDGYYIQDKKIEYSYKSTNKDTYENTETYTEASKR